LSVDVGNLLFDGGRAVGVKKWRPEDLRQEGDYWYSGDTWQVKLYSQGNHAAGHKSIELALRRHIVDQSGKSYVVYEGLALHNGARLYRGSTPYRRATATSPGSAAGTSSRRRKADPGDSATASSSGKTPTITWSKAASSGRCTTPP
jgi:hypothetical protein